jgi:hypothetical protein
MDGREDDTNDIHIPSSFISRASFLVIRDLMNTGHSALRVLIEPDDGYDWYVPYFLLLSIDSCLTSFHRPLSDLLIFVMLLPSVITLLTILLNKYRTHRRVLHASPSHGPLPDEAFHSPDKDNAIVHQGRQCFPFLRQSGFRNNGRRRMILRHHWIERGKERGLRV